MSPEKRRRFFDNSLDEIHESISPSSESMSTSDCRTDAAIALSGTNGYDRVVESRRIPSSQSEHHLECDAGDRVYSDDDDPRLMCVSCQTAKRDCVLLFCKHTRVCSSCVKKNYNAGIDCCMICTEWFMFAQLLLTSRPSECSVCLVAISDVVNVPCGHIVSCVNCSNAMVDRKVSNCPICRSHVSTRVKISLQEYVDQRYITSLSPSVLQFQSPAPQISISVEEASSHPIDCIKIDSTNGDPTDHIFSSGANVSSASVSSRILDTMTSTPTRTTRKRSTTVP